jgi:DNA-binding PadR family transcriptional regulator
MYTNIDYLIMGLLMNGEKSGYDIKKIFELSPTPFVSSSCGSIYPAIKRLEKEGVLEKRLIMQEDKPNKNILSITSKGIEVFTEWLKKPADLKEFTMGNDPFSQKFLFFSYLNESDVKEHCNEQIRMTGILIESIKKFQLKYGKTLDKYALWNLEGTLILFEGRTKWLNIVLSELEIKKGGH